MFREMRRFKQQLEMEETKEILRTAWRGVLSVLGDDDYPYGMPMDFFYDEEKNCLYFHGAKSGHKHDAIQKHDKASFCVMDNGTPVENDWSFYFKSVIVFGRIHVLDEGPEREAAARKLGNKYFPHPEETEGEIADSQRTLRVLVMEIEHMTGKKVHER